MLGDSRWPFVVSLLVSLLKLLNFKDLRCILAHLLIKQSSFRNHFIIDDVLNLNLYLFLFLRYFSSPRRQLPIFVLYLVAFARLFLNCSQSLEVFIIYIFIFNLLVLLLNFKSFRIIILRLCFRLFVR